MDGLLVSFLNQSVNLFVSKYKNVYNIINKKIKQKKKKKNIQK